MKSMKLMTIMVLFLLVAVAGASALPLTVDKVEIDDTELQPNEVNRLDIERGVDVPVDVFFTASEDIENMEVIAFISGYEYNNVDPAADSVGPFDAEANVRYHKKLTIKLSEDFDEDDYKVRIIFSDRYGDEQIQSYNLKVDVPRHYLKIQDVIFNPELSVKAGSALLAQVRLDNMGEKDEQDIKVRVEIPDLGVAGTDYIDEIEQNEHSEETEEIYIRIPMCTKQGIYDVKVVAEYSGGNKEVSVMKAIQVTESEMCEANQGPKTTITLGKQLETVKQGETATYPITISNNLKQSKSYTLSLDVGEWADNVKITPSSTILVGGESSETFYVHATADSRAETGAKVITAKISSSGKLVKQLTLTTNVEKGSWNWPKLALEAAVILLAILVILVAIVVGYLKLRDNSDSDAETYY